MQRQNGTPEIQLAVLYPNGEMMFTTTEQELQDYAKNKVISAFKIVETSGGQYNLHFTVTWKKDGDCVLTSARKELRKWASLNTLHKYIKSLELPDATITLHSYIRTKT